MNAKILGLVICVMLITSCKANKKSNNVEQTTTNETELSQDTLSADIGIRLPASAKEYFLSMNFPYKFPNDLRIDWDCGRKKFQTEDFFIFETKNGKPTCEYIALIDTFPFIEIIAQQCVDMENWIVLYVLNEDYKIIDSELLLYYYMGEGDDTPKKIGNQNFQFANIIDTLTYSNLQYKIFSDEIFVITDDSGKRENDVGIRKFDLLTVDKNGKIIRQRNNVVFKKEYYDSYHER